MTSAPGPGSSDLGCGKQLRLRQGKLQHRLPNIRLVQTMQHKELSSFRALKCLCPEILQESPDLSYLAEFRQQHEEVRGAEPEGHRQLVSSKASCAGLPRNLQDAVTANLNQHSTVKLVYAN